MGLPGACCNGTVAEGGCIRMRVLDLTVNISGCASCILEPPPDILHIPPPPFPAILQQSSDLHANTNALPFLPFINDSPCRYLCNQQTEGVQFIEMPQHGAVFDDTWLLILITSCIGILLVGIVLATLFLKCKFNRNGKSGVISMPNAASSMQSKNGRIQSEAILYPCTTDIIPDSRLMWATLTPRGTTKHYLDEHTYETIANGHFTKKPYPITPVEHTYVDPPVITPIDDRPKDDKAFDNTAFVDYEEPLSVKGEYCKMDEMLEPHQTDISDVQKGTLRPRVSSPTRIENPNLPPLNLHPHKRASSRKGSGASINADTLLRSSITSATYIPTI